MYKSYEIETSGTDEIFCYFKVKNGQISCCDRSQQRHWIGDCQGIGQGAQGSGLACLFDGQRCGKRSTGIGQ